jgi:hypothetical protein
MRMLEGANLMEQGILQRLVAINYAPILLVGLYPAKATDLFPLVEGILCLDFYYIVKSFDFQVCKLQSISKYSR